MLHRLNPFQGYCQYLSSFRHYIGHRIFILFALSLVAVAADSLGIMMLLPLLQISELARDSLGGKAAVLLQAVELLGIPKSQLGVLAFIATAFFLKGCVRFLEGSYRGKLMSQMQQKLRTDLLHGYTEMEYSYYAARNTGHFINVINAQISRFLQSFMALARFSAQCISTAGYLLFALFLSWPFTVMAFIGGMGILSLFRFLSAYSRNLSRMVSQEGSVLQKLLVQMLHSLKYLASTASIAPLERNAAQSIAALARGQFKLQVANAFTTAVKEPIAVFFLIGLLIIQIMFLHQPIGPIFVSLVLFYRAMGSLIAIQEAWQQVMHFIGGTEMVREEFQTVQRHKERSGATKVDGLEKGIAMHNVSFAHDRTHVLQDINLAIPANSTVAIVGESGSGKSTLVDVITLLLKPQSGQLLIDGVPHEELDYREWRRHIGFVTQETVVFDDTVANNISLWTCDYEANEWCKRRVHDAADKAYCHSFISDLPSGYHTVVGDRGVKLSGGQRQRLFIARELFKQPSLLILDEATSSLDTDSEQSIQQSIDQVKGAMTVIIIAHRLSTIKNVDWIYVLDKGRIVEQGTYNDLSRAGNSKFSHMVAMQHLGEAARR